MSEQAAGSDGYRALRHGLAAGPIYRDAVMASGPDAAAFLQGQLSAEVLTLPPGSSTWTWVLKPGGKVEVLARLTRIDADCFVLDTDEGYGDALTARLRRFKLRTKVDFDQPIWTAIAVRGADIDRPAPEAGTVVVADATWPGLAGYDLLGPDPQSPGGAVPVDPADLEIARVEAGIVRMGAELDERTIPAETGLVERTVSFTKGCYTGQELVARIDSRGAKVARRLVGLHLAGDGAAAVRAGAVLRSADKEAGTVTSVALSPTFGPIALGYARRAVDLGATVEVTFPADGSAAEGSGAATATVGGLPFQL